MKKSIFAGLILLVMTMLLFTSCDKNKKQLLPDTVKQGFTLEGVNINNLKSFDINTWLFQYNDQPYTFTLTGQGNASGNVYTQDVTIQDLENGTFTMDILPGEYAITYETEHTITSDPLVYQYTGTPDDEPILGKNLDIGITDTQILLGTPISMMANHEDFMVVLDIPNILTNPNPSNGFAGVGIYYDDTYPNISDAAQLQYNSSGDFWYGYFDRAKRNNSGGFLTMKYYHEGALHTIDLSACVPGKVYHYITDFGASTNLDIPDMITEVIVVP